MGDVTWRINLKSTIILLVATLTASPQGMVNGVITVPYGTTLTTAGIALPSNTTLLIRGRLLHAAGSGASYLVQPATGASNVTIQCEQGGALDGGGVVPTTGQGAMIFVDSNTNFQLHGCTFHNSGTPSNLLGAISTYNSSATVTDIHSDSTLYGTTVKVDCAYSTKRVVVDGVTADGSKDNVIFISNTGATEGACNADISRVSATNISDYSNTAGQKGNVFVVYRADDVHFHDAYASNVRYSCGRVNQSADVFIDHVICDGSQESAFYAELGAKRVHFDHLKILHSKGGVNLSNVEQRVPDQTNSADDIDCLDLSFYCVAVEHDQVSNIFTEGTPIGVLLGIASSSHDNVARNVVCSHMDQTLPPTIACVAAAQSIDTGADYVFSNIARASSIAPLVNIDIPSSPVVSNVTRASPAVVSYSQGVPPQIGAVYCFVQIGGMKELNGQCVKVTATSAGSFTIALDTTAFSPFTIPVGNSPLGVAIGVKKADGSPLWPTSPNLHVQALP